MFEDNPGVRSKAVAAAFPQTGRWRSRRQAALAVSQALFVAVTAALFIAWATHSG
jgi:hypothetical protein